MNVQKANDNSQIAATQKQHNSQRQPPLGKKDSALTNVNHYDPSQRGSAKRRPAPVKQGQTSQSRKLSGFDEQITQQPVKMKNDAVIIKNSDLQQIKSSLKDFQRDQKQQQEAGESIFGLMNSNTSQESEFAGLMIAKQQSQPQRAVAHSFQNETNQNTSQHLAQPGGFIESNIKSPIANNAFNELALNKNPSNIHQLSIVGSSNQPGMTQNQFLDKETKQKLYQDELQRQIRERDEIRKREVDDKTRKFGSLAKQSEPLPNENQTGYFPWKQRSSQENIQVQDYGNNQFNSSDKNLSQKLQDIKTDNRQLYQQQSSTFYNEQPRSNMYQNAMQTKADFPSIMTRGKVTEGRLDIELESRGTIFQGRDEKSILIKKKEETQNAIKDALQKQIEEKQRKKEEDKQKERDFNFREEQRLKQENQGYEAVQTFGRKTTYNNHNQVSIVGSGAGTAQNQDYRQPEIDDLIKSPNQKNVTNREHSTIQPIPEEMISSFHAQRKMSDPQEQAQIFKEAEHLDSKNKQINELSDMVKILLQEQQSLKEKLEQQEYKMKEINDKGDDPILVRKHTAITKKASERVRSQNPPKKTVQSADNKTVQARKMKEQHAIEQAKLEAIENKIVKARQRIEDAKTQKQIKAVETRVKIDKSGATGENINELLYGESQLNQDLYQQEKILNSHVPLIGGRQKSNAGIGQNERVTKQLSTAPHNNSKSSYQAAAMVLSNNKSGIPPTAGASNFQRNLGHDASRVNKPQKAPRGNSNKTSSSQLPMSSIDYDNHDYEEESELSNHPIHETRQSPISNKLQQNVGQNNSRLVNQTNDAVYNLDSDGVSQLTYPLQDGAQFYSPNLVQSSTKKLSSPIRQQDTYDPQQYNRNPMANHQQQQQQNYNNMNYDPMRYQPQQNQVKQRQMSEFNYEQHPMEIHGSKEFLAGRTNEYFVSKNPSTAAGSYLHGLGGGYAGAGLTSGGGVGMGQMATESFDLDIMMPPDIASIDSDINKLNAMTPTPMQNNLGWGFENNFGFAAGGYPNELGSTNKISQQNQLFDDSQSIYDSKYSPSRAGGASAYSRDNHGPKQNINRFYDQ